MKMNRSSILLVLAVLFVTSLQARPIPGRWEKVASLSSGIRIVLKWKSGDKVEYVYRASRDDQLLVSDLVGNELEIPKSQVKKIERGIPSNDNLVDGTLWGAGIGFGVASLFGTVCFGGSCL